MNVKKATLLVLLWWHYPIFLRKGHPNSNFSNKISNKLFHCFHYNHTKVNPGKSHLPSSSKIPTNVFIGDASLKTSTKETLLGIFIDSELSFDQHVSSIFSKASKKLHALGRIATFMSFKKHTILMKAFFRSQFNYCPLIWCFTQE